MAAKRFHFIGLARNPRLEERADDFSLVRPIERSTWPYQNAATIFFPRAGRLSRVAANHQRSTRIEAGRETARSRAARGDERQRAIGAAGSRDGWQRVPDRPG